jgi:RND superfamily putative drug exporter
MRPAGQSGPRAAGSPRAPGALQLAAGKAVLFSGVTVLISLSAVMLVPSPAFRSMSLGIMLAVIFVLAATLTLLPAVLAKLGPKVDQLALPWVFQDSALHSLLGFEPQGFLDAWGPVFFFAMIFAISMDYTVFLLSSAAGAPVRRGTCRAGRIGCCRTSRSDTHERGGRRAGSAARAAGG